MSARIESGATQPAIDLRTIDAIVGGRLGVHDSPCPLCSRHRKAINQCRAVLRVWREDPGFVTYHCAHCGANGYVRDASSPQPDPTRLARLRAEAWEREQICARERIDKARWLWSHREPIAGTLAERYLREARGYIGPLPDTLGFLASRGEYAPAMIAAFGLAVETTPGVIKITDMAVRAAHLTRLKPDGSGQAGSGKNKIMIGRPSRSPIVLAPLNDGLGLAITEGIEDALSVHMATGLGAWAAGSASQLPGLADVIPAMIECVTIVADADAAGQRGADALAERLCPRGFAVEIVTLEQRRGE